MAKVQTVLVTGATGRVGGQVAAQLAKNGNVQLRALTRSSTAAASAGLPQGVEVVRGDLTSPESLSAALDGVDAVFLVFPSVTADASARNLVATLTKQARRLIYLSAYGVPNEPATQAEPDGTILGSHAHLEGAIAAAAAEYTFIRASGFATNTLGWADQLRRSNVLRWFLPEARRALVHEADLASVAVRALTEDGHHRMAYHVTGPEQLTQREQLSAIGDAVGRTLRFQEIDADEAATELFAGYPTEIVRSIITGQAAMMDHPEPRTDTVATLTGRPALSFAQWARDHVTDFTGPDH